MDIEGRIVYYINRMEIHIIGCAFLTSLASSYVIVTKVNIKIN